MGKQPAPPWHDTRTAAALERRDVSSGWPDGISAAGISQLAVPVAPVPQAADVIRVMTYNVWLGMQWEEARETIHNHPADILCLQEVAVEDHPRRDFVRPSQIAAEFAGECNYQPLWRQGRGWLGNMTLVRCGRLGATTVLHCRSSEPYGTWSHVSMGRCEFVVANIHLTPMLGFPPLAYLMSEPLRTREAVHLARCIRRSSCPVIALGDYNTFWPSPGYLAAASGMRDCRSAGRGPRMATRPTYGLPFVIDHIFVTPQVEVLDYDVIDAPGSDHRPVVATVKLPETNSLLA